jgi:photosystem II stability/assembly factor-like uncharacterized protein
VGNQGLCLKTTDGGWRWEQCQTNTTTNFLDVQFIDDSVGFISGVNGTLIKTTDGGNTWNTCTTNTTLNITGIYFLNRNFGWVAGSMSSLFPEPNDTGIILKTTDGGNTFILSKNVDASVQKISAYNVDTCIAICNYLSSFVIRTTNSGSTWQTIQLNSINSDLTSIAILTSGLTYVSNDLYTLYQSNDFGATWNSSQSFISGQLPVDLSFPSPLIGYTAGFNVMGGGGAVCSTGDGGQTWEYEIQGNYSFVTVNFCNDSIGFAASQDGHIWKHGLLTNVNSVNQQNVPNIIIYPNPVRSSLNIKIHDNSPNNNSQSPSKVEIYSLMGDKILEQSCNGTIFNINGLEFLSPGSYYLVLKNQAFIFLSKQIIKIE